MKLGNSDVLSCQVTWHLRGPWVGEFDLDTDEPPSGAVTITDDSGLSLSATVTEPGRSFAGRTSVRVVGGGGGLGTPVEKQQYRSAPVNLILRDLCREAGERLDSSVSLSQTFTFWTRPAHSPARILDDLCSALGLGWRVLDSGAIWVGAETWPTLTGDVHVLDEDSGSGVLVLSDETILARPGQTFDGRRLVSVQHTRTRQRARSRAWVGDSSSRALGDVLARVVSARSPSPIWGGLHPSTVVTQAADGSLEVIPDDPRVPPMAGLPLRTGIPGLAVEVLQGARVLVGFEGQDPQKPIALPAFDKAPDKLKSLHVTADTEISVNAPSVKICDDGGELLIGDAPANPLARVGDIVQVAMSIPIVAGSGAPLFPGVSLTSVSGGPVSGTIGMPDNEVILVGQILSGFDRAKA